jgi:tRNA (guanine-N7-)-methyltransferase
MEKNIYDVIMTNDEESPLLKIEGNFEFPNKIKLSNTELLALHNNTVRFEGGFIHFERVYELIDGVMLRISMGSFDRPEHLYLIINDNRLAYFPNFPLRSPSNLEAHQHLLKVLNG